MSDTNPIWLPPRRHHAAPHLLVDSTGKNNLIWMSRNNPGDSITCIVVTDATKLMTYTLPRRDLCSIDAASQLDMVEVDMFSTTPLPVEIPELPLPYRIFATGFSAQKAADDSLSLSLCSRSASRPVDPDKPSTMTRPDATCSPTRGFRRRRPWRFPELCGGAAGTADRLRARCRPEIGFVADKRSAARPGRYLLFPGKLAGHRSYRARNLQGTVDGKDPEGGAI